MFIVKFPENTQWQITLAHGTNCCDWFVKIELLFSKIEWRYLWRHLKWKKFRKNSLEIENWWNVSAVRKTNYKIWVIFDCNCEKSMTIDWQIWRIRCYSSTILSIACIVSSVSAFDCIKDQHAHSRTISCYCDAIITSQIMLRFNGTSIETPKYLHRQVSFAYWTSCWSILVNVEFIFSKWKWCNGGQNLERDDMKKF